MTEQYSQTVEVALSKSVRTTRNMGAAAFLIALTFVIIAGFVSWYFMIGFGVFFAVAAIEIHFFNASPKEFIYDFSMSRLVIAKKDIVNRTRRMLCVAFIDVKEFGVLDGLSDDDDIVACESSSQQGVYQLVFDENGKYRRLLFAPDDYLVELISAALKNVAKGEEGDK